MKKILFLIASLYVSMASMAWDIYQDSIYFNIVDATKHTVEVCAGEKPYTGDVVIPESVPLGRNNYKVAGIGKEAFMKQDVTSVTMPSTIKYIDEKAFYFCEGLTSITFPNSVLSLGMNSFDGCINLETINFGNSLQSIGPYAFSSCKAIKELTIPKSVEVVDRGAFIACSSLTRVHFEGRIPSLGQQMFSDCKSLVSLTSVDASPEDGTLYVPNHITDIGSQAFRNTKFRKLIMSNSVTSISLSAFSYCSVLDSIILSNNLKTIGSFAFSGLHIKEINIPESVTTIKDGAFFNCDSIKSIKLPNIETISERMLNACKNLRYLVVPNSVKKMEQDALESCRALTQVDIGSSVEEICAECFLYCEKLSALFVHATTPPVLDEKAFEGKAYNYVLVNVPIGCAEKYKQAPVWKNFKYIQEGATDRYDVNEDGYINAADVVSIYNRIINGD